MQIFSYLRFVLELPKSRRVLLTVHSSTSFDSGFLIFFLFFFRLTISDGAHYGHAVIRDLLFREEELSEGYLVRIDQYVCKELVDGIKVIVIGKLRIVHKLKLAKIGCPKWVEEEKGSVQVSNAETMENMKERHQHRKRKPPQQPPQEMNPQRKKREARKEKRTSEGGTIASLTFSDHSRRQNSPNDALFSSNILSKVGPENQMKRKAVRQLPSPCHRKKPFALQKAFLTTEISKAPAAQSSQISPYQGIRFISPYRRRWEIKGRCSFKGNLEEFQSRNGKGKGVFFSFQLTDNTGSIDITAFSEVAQSYSEQIRLNHVYVVGNGHLRVAHSKFNRSTSFYQMHLTEKSVVREVADDGSIVAPKPKFVKIRDLLRTRANSLVDVLGVVEDISAVTQVYLRSTGKEVLRRTITILDDSKASVSLILWGKKVDTLRQGEEKSGKILMVRGARRGYYGGIQLTVGRQTALTVNPTMDEANRLQTWYFRETGNLGRSQFFCSVLHLTRLESPFNKDRLTLTMGKEKFSTAAGAAHQVCMTSEKRNPSSFTMRGMIAEIRQDIMMSYPSDPFTKKKVEEVAPGMWYSASSNRNFPNDMVVWRYALWVKVVDETGGAWMCAFDEAAQIFLGYPAREMEKIKEKEKKKWNRLLSDACFEPLVIEVVAKSKTYRGETNLHYVMNQVEFVNFAAEGRFLWREIQDFLRPKSAEL